MRTLTNIKYHFFVATPHNVALRYTASRSMQTLVYKADGGWKEHVPCGYTLGGVFFKAAQSGNGNILRRFSTIRAVLGDLFMSMPAVALARAGVPRGKRYVFKK